MSFSLCITALVLSESDYEMECYPSLKFCIEQYRIYIKNRYFIILIIIIFIIHRRLSC